ncbi:MAG: alpha/beta hydrolase [Chloroflexi bacterium]|nr:alpha/beta hydrolase [Chloroflexota bacterium]
MTASRWLCLLVILALLLAACDSAAPSGDSGSADGGNPPIPSQEKTRVASSEDEQPAEKEAKPTKTAPPKATKTPKKPADATLAPTPTVSLTPTPQLTPTPKETVRLKEETLKAADGLKLRYSLYVPVDAGGPAPLILIAPMHIEKRQAWDGLARILAKEGFIVAVMDLRGAGETGGAADWPRAADDLQRLWKHLSSNENVDASRTALIGASMGANLALRLAANEPKIAAAALLSPGQNYRGVTTGFALRRYGARPLLIFAGEDDPVAGGWPDELRSLARDPALVQIEWIPGSAHGSNLLATQESRDRLVDWLAQEVKSPPPGPPRWLGFLQTYGFALLCPLSAALLLFAALTALRLWRKRYVDGLRAPAEEIPPEWVRVWGHVSAIQPGLGEPGSPDAPLLAQLAAVRLLVERNVTGKWQTYLDKTVAARFAIGAPRHVVWVQPEAAWVRLEGPAQRTNVVGGNQVDDETQAEIKAVLPLFNLDPRQAHNRERRFTLWEARLGQAVAVEGVMRAGERLIVRAAGEKLLISTEEEAAQVKSLAAGRRKAWFWLALFLASGLLSSCAFLVNLLLLFI